MGDDVSVTDRESDEDGVSETDGDDDLVPDIENDADFTKLKVDDVVTEVLLV